MLRGLILAATLTFGSSAFAKPNIVEANPKTLEAEASKGLVVVDFYTTWCPWCRVEAAILDQLAAEHPDLKIVRFNAEQYPLESVNTYPTVLVVYNGKQVQLFQGAATKEDLLKVMTPYFKKDGK